MKIQWKILALLAALGLVTLGVAWYGGKVLLEADDSYSDMVDTRLPDTVKLARVNRLATEMVYAGYKAMAYDGASETARAAAKDEAASFEKALKYIDEVSTSEPKQADTLKPLADLVRELHARLQNSIALGLRNDDEGARKVLVTADDTAARLTKAMAALNDGRIKDTAQTSTALSARSLSMRTTLLATAAVALVAAMGLAAFLSKSQIVAPLLRLQDAMRALAGGNTAVDVPGTDRRDEVGTMAQSVLVFRQAAVEQAAANQAKAASDAAQRHVVETLEARLNQLAGGDLTATIDSAFAPEYEAVKTNFNAAVAALRDLIASVMESAETISTGSAEIAQASEDLARRTEAAAASLEETSAAVTEMGQRIKNTATAGTQTVERATGAIGVVDSGRSVADEAMQAMSRVSESAKGIDTVIEGLDKIAFQTRVLAMNAAVEAGRAGEAGRGFAVVADLVSALAMRAEEEAGRARDQLTTTQTDINAAVEMVRRVDSALGAIVGDVNEVHGLLETMARDNQAQASTVSQVQTAVGSIDQMTQQNAAMVEQTSAAARNLNTEVSSLKAQALRFNTGRGATRAMAAPSRTAPTAAFAPSNRPVAEVRAVTMATEDWASF
ncbi:methyl-accepting chemotaxis protein [uncultured Sphingomonas sp.]|uniref:methyl-accepting chemotaxis protein n=1 Tax=uncultured Sphingomonas sp. TaxID=158754 RepID=UPI0025D9B656|nr:methyl-accepting chemotaxis protein [uncultured Sphingomonas sp.]